MKLDAFDGLVKWLVELSEFDITYRPRRAIKSQALADFVAKCTELDEGVYEGRPAEKERPEGVWLIMV